MKCPHAGCEVSEIGSTSDKPCNSILNVLEPGSIMG